MPSVALKTWTTIARVELDELEAAHAAVGGTSRGRRYATLQLNHAYTVLLSSQFQRFCRDLHTEAAYFLVQYADAGLRPVVQSALVEGRKLDFGNPNESNVGSDFARLGMTRLWDAMTAHHPRNALRRKKLQELGQWRNAIAHQDFAKVGGSATLQLKRVRSWRSACAGLARSLDVLVGDHVLRLVATRPW